jgi:tripartite-type tricarboxylate transporter receptor subunit TctC
MRYRTHRRAAARHGPGWRALAFALVFASSTGLAADKFPSKPIRLVTAEAGGGSDFVSRIIAQGLNSNLGVPVVVDNRGGGVIAGDIVARAPADGYTVLYYGSTLWLLPLVRKHVPYDPLKDFAPITQAVSTPAILVVHPSVPAKSVKELIALARAQPGKLNYASAAIGTATHVSAELFKHLASVNIVRVPYKGTGTALNDLLGGQVQMMFAVSASVTAHIKAGRLRPLGVTATQREAAFPDLPTIAEAGVPGYEAIQASGLFTPAKTPPDIVRFLNQEVRRVLTAPAARDRLAPTGADVVAGSPEAFRKRIHDDVATVGKLFRAAGITEE